MAFYTMHVNGVGAVAAQSTLGLPRTMGGAGYMPTYQSRRKYAPGMYSLHGLGVIDPGTAALFNPAAQVYTPVPGGGTPAPMMPTSMPAPSGSTQLPDGSTLLPDGTLAPPGTFSAGFLDTWGVPIAAGVGAAVVGLVLAKFTIGRKR